MNPLRPVIVTARLVAAVLAAIDTHHGRDDAVASRATGALAPDSRTACEGARPPLPAALFFELRSGAFPGSGHPDVAVHVPPGFDATRRPGVILYLHGWNGCAAAALSGSDDACGDAGAAGADLGAQLDAAGANAVLVAVETRFQMATGEPGRLAMPAGGRELMRELLTEDLAAPLGCAVPVEAIDRVAIVAHSGGYQSAASLLLLGDLPRVTEVDLLDALYGAEDVFSAWIASRAARFDPATSDGTRFVDLYTCCGGTARASRALLGRARGALTAASLPNALFDDDGDPELDPAILRHPIVFKRVPRPHSELPSAYARSLFETAGFAKIAR